MLVSVSHFSLSLQAQMPTYLCELRNDVQVSGNIFEFDIYLLQTGTTPFEYAAGQYGILVNPLIKNGGIITASIVAGSSDPALVAKNQNPINISFLDVSSCVRIAGRVPPGAGNGTIISNITPGMKVCRVRLTNTVAFAPIPPDLTWTTNTIYPTQINAYVGGLNISIMQANAQTTNKLNNNNNPLPIELLSFEGQCNENGTELIWVTATESNNDYFTIQKSNNTGGFEDFAQISGAGNSNSYQYYSYNDTHRENGITYYRLKQTDFDGHFTYSKTIYTDCYEVLDASNSYNLFVSGEKEITITYSSEPGTISIIQAYDINGRIIATIYDGNDNNEGINSRKFKFNKSGVFIVKAVIGNNAYSNKIIVF